jgi:phenylacetic acid degradation operon negative regulatory protein
MTSTRNTGGLLDRPLSARSVMASLLLGSHPPRLSGARLVRWCGVFGIAEGTARVALSRMVDHGELTTRAGVYELAGAMRGRQRAQDWSREPHLLEWDGEWRIGVVTAPARNATDRGALRDAMRRLHLGEVRAGVWCRPDNLPRAAGPAAAWEIAQAQCAWWRAEPEEDPKELAAELFAPAAWAARAESLYDHLTVATRALRDPADSDLAHAFEVGAAVLAHVRADPLLPAPLLTRRWPGTRLRDAYEGYEVAFGEAVRNWFRAEAQ